HLVGLLWAESPDDKARRSLNEAVRRLRTALGEGRLLNRGDGLQLSTDGLELDLREFESLCANGQLRALELLRGDFLEGFHVDDAPAFDDWMEAERLRLREAARRLVVARAEEQLAVNRYVEARALAGRARLRAHAPARRVRRALGPRRCHGGDGADPRERPRRAVEYAARADARRAARGTGDPRHGSSRPADSRGARPGARRPGPATRSTRRSSGIRCPGLVPPRRR